MTYLPGGRFEPKALLAVPFSLQRDRFLAALTADGTAQLTPIYFAGKPAVRAAFVNWSTSGEDVVRVLEALERWAQQVR